MGSSHKWLRIIRRKFLVRSSNRDHIILPCTNYLGDLEEEAKLVKNNEANAIEDDGDLNLSIPTSPSSRLTLLFTKEDVAAIKIQAFFRGHLARRAYGALKSLVKVQALVRGALVRKQSRIAMQCMHALVRLQVRVRARQLLGTFDNNHQSANV